MKKLLLAFTALACGAALSAQVLQSSGVQNTVWSGFGNPLDSGKTKFYGLTDTLQARIDSGIFTTEAMINWGAIANWTDDDSLDNVTLENTEWNALSFHYFNDGGDTNTTAFSNASNRVKNVDEDSYYVNFLMHPAKGWDAGMGTKLNWKVGPAPSYGAWVWEKDAHIKEGGFSTSYDDRHGYANESEANGGYVFTPDVPGTADVVGFVPYANRYAKTALGVRYVEDGLIQAGFAIPSGTNTDHPLMNAGLSFTINKIITVSGAYEGLFQTDGNLYTGASIGVADGFLLDAYFAWDSIDSNDDTKDMSYSLGAALTFVIPNTKISLRPEGAVNWFEESDYTPAWYTGASLKLPITSQFEFSAWSSFASGSKNKNWDDKSYTYYSTTKDYDGGFVIDVRPEVSFQINTRHNIAAAFDWENRKAFDGEKHNCWSFGGYWTYKY